MAWYKRYQIPFESKDHIQYMVYIYEETSGSLVTLTGAPEPFVTQEDASDDIFTPIRQQTGTLRIIDETGSLLETLIPQNNTQKRVQLVSGSWNSSFSSFTDGSVLWEGFLCAEAFTQPWDNQKNIIEFPVKSLLAALEDIQIPVANASLEKNIATLLTYAFTAIKVQPDSVYMISDLTIDSSTIEQFFTACVTWSLFFSEEEALNQSDITTELIGISYKEALSIIASMYGLCFREKGNKILISQYDNIGQIISVTLYTWQNIISLANGSAPSVVHSTLPDVNMLSTITFKGDNNIAAFLQGRREAIVGLAIGGLTLNIKLPQTTEDDTTVVIVPYIVGGIVWCQPHVPRTSSLETFTYKKIAATATGSPNIYYIYSLLGDANYTQCIQNSVLLNPGAGTPPSPLYTGAFPCRWFYKATDDGAAIDLKNGLFLNQESAEENRDSPAAYQAYSIKSALEFNLSPGYINIDFQQHSFIHGYRTSQYHWDFDSIPTAEGLQLQMYISLRVGSKWWNGSTWTNIAYSSFLVPFKNANIVSNKTASMNVDGTSGWFIPITTNMSGEVELYIYNAVIVSPYQSTQGRLEAHSRIISDLKVEFYMNNSKTASSRSQNIYRQTILANGFTDSESVNLQLGTLNNNRYHPCFIKDKDLNFIKTFKYLRSRSGSSILSIIKRPEEYLLDRMAAHYNQIRRTFIGVVQTGVDIALQRFTFNSRNYFGIDKQHNWRDDTQEVKFIEVS